MGTVQKNQEHYLIQKLTNIDQLLSYKQTWAPNATMTAGEEEPRILVNDISDLAGGICGCGGMCKAMCCPCMAVGEIAKHANGKYAMYCLLNVCCKDSGLNSCIMACCVLKDLRRKHGMVDATCRDYCVHACCNPCALAQELRFVQKVKELQLNAIEMGQTVVKVPGPTRQSM